MLLALEYLHSLDIVHRDVKAENFLFSGTGSIYTTPLKLIDFGMAVKRCGSEHMLHELCGSPHYLAPELIGQQYDSMVDLWALGVLLFLLLYGRYPYDAQDSQQLMIRILTEPIDWKHPCAKLSSSCLELIRGLLDRNVAQRTAAGTAKRQPWIINNIVSMEQSIKPVNRTNVVILDFIRNQKAAGTERAHIDPALIQQKVRGSENTDKQHNSAELIPKTRLTENPTVQVADAMDRSKKMVIYTPLVKERRGTIASDGLQATGVSDSVVTNHGKLRSTNPTVSNATEPTAGEPRSHSYSVKPIPTAPRTPTVDRAHGEHPGQSMPHS